MGCGNSSPVHPAIYNETIGKKQKANGVVKPKPVRESNPKHLTGDYSQFQVAKHQREKTHKDRQIKVFIAADEMTGRVLEEREMLSLGTRSRGTSRNTSRGTSPTGTKRNQEQRVTMTPVTEDKLSRGTSLRSETELPHHDSAPKKKLKTHKHSKSKGKGKGKKHRKGKKSKRKKDKSSKDTDDTDNENLDSGVDEDENEDDNDDNSDKENIETVMNANDIPARDDPLDGKQVTIGDTDSKRNTQRGRSPTHTGINSKRVKFQSASNDSGIVVVGSDGSDPETAGVNAATKILENETREHENAMEQERSDCRI